MKLRRFWAIGGEVPQLSVCELLSWRLSFLPPQRSCGKVMFLHLSVILFTRVSATPPHPLGRQPPRQTPPRADTHLLAGTPPPPDRHPPVQCMMGYGKQVRGTHPTGMQSFVPYVQLLCSKWLTYNFITRWHEIIVSTPCSWVTLCKIIQKNKLMM